MRKSTSIRKTGSIRKEGSIKAEPSASVTLPEDASDNTQFFPQLESILQVGTGSTCITWLSASLGMMKDCMPSQQPTTTKMEGMLLKV